jgi:N-acetylornithine carbamoyltransferase
VKKRDLLALEDWSPEDYERLLALVARVKRGEIAGGLSGKVLAQVFLQRDPRTQASVDIAMYVHGGHATALDLSSGGAEHVFDLARSLAGWVDGVAVRSGSGPGAWRDVRTDMLLRSFTDACEKPVLNLGSARRNPCQALADSLTLQERLGHPEGKRFVLAWSWDPEPLATAVPASSALAAARLGMEIVIARPEGYELDPEDTGLIRKTAQQHGGEFVHISDDLDDALVGADVVYVASWGSVKLYEQPEDEARLRGQQRDWGLTRARHRGTRGGKGVVMHAGPVRRNVAIADQVLDRADSAVLEQSHNLFHAHRALLLELLNPGVDG